MNNNSEHHDWVMEDLTKSGLNREQFHIELLKNEDKLKERLRFDKLGVTKIIDVDGYWIPYPNVPGYYRLKLKHPIETDSGKVKYLSPKKEMGFGNHAYILLEVEKICRPYNPDKPLFFTEGEKKAVKATSEGFPCIGLSGVWCFKDSENDLISDLENLNLRHRKVFIVFDSDVTHKTQVCHAELRLSVELLNRGAIPFSVRLSNQENGEKNGLDDYLVIYGRDKFQDLVNNAIPTIQLQIKEGTDTSLLITQLARLKSEIQKEKYANLLAEREGVNKRNILKEMKSLIKASPISESENKQYRAVFEGLVDIVDHNGQVVYIVKESNELVINESVEIDGEIYYPPPRENLPFKGLARAEEVIKHYKSDSDVNLYSDLLDYHKSISELPNDSFYDLLVAWVLLTYLPESTQYSPYIWLYAIPERGKSRTGKGCIYVAYRGIHVESLREAYLLRVSNDLRATIFFDVMNLSKKAERAGSEDILLQRFEKGAMVPRVLYPDRGPHQDTVYYDVFGSTIIATNEPVHEILETRALMISMPESSKRYEKDVRPEDGLILKERLTAFRARHLNIELLEVQKPTKGRLGDIVKPLLQIIRLVNPEREIAFLDLIGDIESQRKEQKSESNEARLVSVIEELEYEVVDGLLPIKLITDHFNKNVKDKYHTTTRSVGWKASALGFQKRKRSDGSCIEWDDHLLDKLKERFGLQTEENGEDAFEIKHHKRHDRHSASNDSTNESDVSNDVFPREMKSSLKHHNGSPNKERDNDNYDENDVFLDSTQGDIDKFLEEVE